MDSNINAFTSQQNILNAQLIVYPGSAQDAQFQYPDSFVAHAGLLLG